MAIGPATANQTAACTAVGPEESGRARQAAMSKATSIRQQNAREKIAAQRAAARGAEVRRQVLIAGGSVVVVLAIVLTFVFIKLGNKPGGSGSGHSGEASTQPATSARNS